MEFAKVNLNNKIKFKPKLKGIEYLNQREVDFYKNNTRLKGKPINWIDKIENGFLTMQLHEFIREFSEAGYFLDQLININVEIEIDEV